MRSSCRPAIRPSRRRGWLATLLVAAVLVTVTSIGVPPAQAAPTFTSGGSIRQVFTYGHAAGTAVTLRNSANALVATGVADAQGAFLFREVTPGAGYTVNAGGTPSAPLTVTSPTVHPSAAFYQNITLNAGYGYLPTRDGTLLAVNITFPTNGAPQPWPVLVTYSGYDPAQPGTLPPETAIYPYFGYVVVAVNMRGTTCSGGAFSFFEEPQRTDGYDAIEAVASQPWSNGDVGMVGISYSGYSQLYVAATRPPHLRAITPLAPFSDGYRGILYPGGILNDGFARNWAIERQQASAPAAHQWVQDRIANGDTTCASNQVLRLQSQDLTGEITPGRFNDPAYAHLDPEGFAPLINVPTFLSTHWQDEQTGGYGAELATTIAPNTKLRAEFSNGTHVDPLGPEMFFRVTEFVDFYVGKRIPIHQNNIFYRNAVAAELSKLFGTEITLPPGRAATSSNYQTELNAYEAEPPVRIRYENGGVAGKEGAPYATTTVAYSAWPIPGTETQRWFLQPDGRLTATAPTLTDDQARGVSSYTYDPTAKTRSTFSGPNESIWLSHPDVDWRTEVAGKSLSFITPAATTTTAYAGTGSADLWLRSSAVDTDLEVTLTEVRPDGNEVFVQSGWLRASLRKLDTARSTELRPRQTFLAGDAQPLPAGQFVPVRIELFPFAHIVRPGSQLRVNIEAPGGNQPFWAFDALDGTATNDIAHSISRPSSIALPRLTDTRAATAAPVVAPSCSVPGVTSQAQSLRNQPCRPYRWSGSGFRSVAPTRLLDTRTGTPFGAVGGTISNLPVATGSPVPSTATAVVLNVTATGATAPTYVTLWPAGATQPTVSNLNVVPGQTVPNLATVPVGTGGAISLYNFAGLVDVVVDVVGYYDDGSAGGGLFTGATPARVLDSRSNTGNWSSTPLTAGTPRNVKVRGTALSSVPPTATAVVANVTITGGSDSSYLRVWPAGGAVPATSNLNYVAGQTVANLVTMAIGTNGELSIANHVGTVHVIVDVLGWYDPTSGSRFHALNPVRVLDNRSGLGLSGRWTPNTARRLQVSGVLGVPDHATAVVANLTATGATAGTYITAYPQGPTPPTSSNLNLTPGTTVPNLTVSRLGTGGGLMLYNFAGDVDLILDVAGWFGSY